MKKFTRITFIYVALLACESPLRKGVVIGREHLPPHTYWMGRHFVTVSDRYYVKFAGKSSSGTLKIEQCQVTLKGYDYIKDGDVIVLDDVYSIKQVVKPPFN